MRLYCRLLQIEESPIDSNCFGTGFYLSAMSKEDSNIPREKAKELLDHLKEINLKSTELGDLIVLEREETPEHMAILVDSNNIEVLQREGSFGWVNIRKLTTVLKTYPFDSVRCYRVN